MRFLCNITWTMAQVHLERAGAKDTIEGLLKVRRQAQEAAASSPTGRPDNVLAWTRALIPYSIRGVSAPCVEGSWHWDIRPSELPVSGVAYPDASMLDGPGLVVGRLGWAFVIIELNPLRIVASAYGTVLDWIRSMLAAEGWALYMSSTILMPSSSYVTDCLEVAKTIRKGPAWATAPSRPLARLDGMLRPPFDADGDCMKVDWMPSHLTVGTMAERRKLDGERVTDEDVFANRRADELAKRGAALHRVDEAARHELEQTEAAAHWIAKAVGLATWAANNKEDDP